MQEKTGGRWTLSEPSLLSKILPKYMILPLVILIVGDLLAYYGPRYINLFLGRPHLDMSCLFDAKISLIPGFVFIYVLAFPFWYLITYFYLRLGREQALRFSISNISAKMLCAALFILIPSALVRPELAGETPSVRLLGLIYSNDAPNNLFPSIHCLESWFCFRCLWDEKKVPLLVKGFAFVFAGLICASTVLTKQHVLLDIPAGILVAEVFWRINSLHLLRRAIRTGKTLIAMFRG